MAVCPQKLLFSPFFYGPIANPIIFRFANPVSPITRFLCFSTQTLSPSQEAEEPAITKWQTFRKKKVVMRVGYVGSDYRGLQKQRDEHSLSTIEDELENAIYKAGGIMETNFGNLNKIAWARSSRTDKGVHSLSTTITFKMEIPDFAWKGDPYGIDLADHINHHLPSNIRVFSILPSTRSFDPRRACNIRKYSYLLPAEIIGIGDKLSTMEVDHHISDFNNILNSFEGHHPFHNYTVRSKYKRKFSGPKSRKDRRSKIIEKPDNSVSDSETEESDEDLNSSVNDDSDVIVTNTISESSTVSGLDERLIDTYRDCEESERVRSSDMPVRAKWLYEPDENDRVSSSHFRRILRCSSGETQRLLGTDFVEITVWGESFMLHQIRKMVGTAVAVKRDIFHRDLLELSLAKFSRIVLPLAPSETLILRGNNYQLRNLPGEPTRPEMLPQVESEAILANVEKFYESKVLPQIARFLDPSRPPWKDWTENLEQARIPETQLDEVREAFREWHEKLASRKEAEQLISADESI